MDATQWIVELSNGTDDPDYYGPFPTQDAARSWRGEREWAATRTCVYINVFPPSSSEDDYNTVIRLTED